MRAASDGFSDLLLMGSRGSASGARKLAPAMPLLALSALLVRRGEVLSLSLLHVCSPSAFATWPPHLLLPLPCQWIPRCGSGTRTREVLASIAPPASTALLRAVFPRERCGGGPISLRL